MKAMEIITAVGAAIGAVMLLSALTPSMSAVQQGAMAAVAVGFAVIPYCVTAMLQRRALVRLATQAADRSKVA